MNYERWFIKATESIQKNIAVGEQFEVRDLFAGTQWDKLDPGERRSFGRYFSAKVRDDETLHIGKVGECKNHHNKYVRTK